MILLDSLYINNSGGLRLLDYLVSSLIEKEIDFCLLADERCKGRFDRCKQIKYMHASLRQRTLFYKKEGKSFSSVLCFGNIPAPIKMKVPVYTYFHNINLLTLHRLPSIKVFFMSWLKREVFRHYKINTNYWLVQTSNTKVELVHHLKESEDRVKLMPFYDIPDALKDLVHYTHGDDYVYVANYTGSKQHEELLDAWILLHKIGVDKTLHLTIPEDQIDFGNKVRKAQQSGVKVVNHGFLPFDEIIKLYAQSKAIVYPSINESLGLGIVEGISAGCDVLGADLPYIHAICKPSGVFNPYSAESIANAVIKYEKEGAKKSELLISNQIEELIELLYWGYKGVFCI